MSTTYPVFLLLGATALIVLLILRWRVTAFWSLLITALLVGLATPGLGVERVMKEVAGRFGDIVGRIGIVILMAGIVGYGMMESGAADKVVRKFVAIFRRRLASLALLAAGFLLSIPVFADTVFYLMVPLARSMSVRLGGNYILYIMSVSSGATVTHAFVPPTPGPLAAAAALNVDLGVTILVGILVAIPVSICGWVGSYFWDRKMNLPIREAPGPSLEELRSIAALPDEHLPGFWLSISPILLPVVLIGGDSIVKVVAPGTALAKVLSFAGDPSFALMLAAVVALYLLARKRQTSFEELMKTAEKAMLGTANVIFITAAGGAFGGMLQTAGVGTAMGKLAGAAGFSLITLGFVLSALFKIAQGSSTVCMITVSSILAPLAAAAPPPYHSVYLVLAVAAGTLVGNWMNDSGFWVFQTLTGLTEIEALKSRTVILAISGFVGYFTILLLSMVLPLR